MNPLLTTLIDEEQLFVGPNVKDSISAGARKHYNLNLRNESPSLRDTKMYCIMLYM